MRNSPAPSSVLKAAVRAPPFHVLAGTPSCLPMNSNSGGGGGASRFGAEVDVELHQREIDGRHPAELRRPDVEVDADLVPPEEDEPDVNAQARAQEERVPLHQDVDVDVEPRFDAGELGPQRRLRAGHQRLRRAAEEHLDREVDEVVDRRLDADPDQLRVVLRLGEQRMVAADREQEVALVRRRRTRRTARSRPAG